MTTEKTIGFVFPGQGSQAVGMLAEQASTHPIIQTTFNEASAVLGYDLWQVAQLGPADQLNQTRITQPALLTAGVALWRLWSEAGGPMPAYLAGHSLGEYTALVCADALAFTDAVALVAERGRCMQAAVPVGQGAMAAIVGLSVAEVNALCAAHSDGNQHQVAAANINAHGQVVVAGHVGAVEAVMSAAKPAGAKLAKRLPMSVPSHCPLMLPAAMALSDYLAKVPIQTPKIPLINNVNVAIESTPDLIRTALIDQLSKPVQWVNTIEMMADKGVDLIVECGPGKVLSGLIKRIIKTMPTMALDTQVPIQMAIDEAK